MTTVPSPKRLGFFTRLLDQADAAERYRLATAQIVHAERCGFDSAWVAQHHFHEAEGGLPAPFVFLAQVAARTSRIRLGTGIVTLPLELPIRVAEDAAVLDLMSGGRLEVGVGPGGNLTAFTAFGLDSNDRHALMAHHLDLMRTAWTGGALPGGDRLYPANPTLVDRIWQATFSVEGAQRAGRAGDGLMLSRTQPRAPDAPEASLADIQNPMIDAYLEALPQGPRAAHPGLAHGVRGRRPQGGDALLPKSGCRGSRREAGRRAALPSGSLGRRSDPGVRRPYRHARGGDRLAAGRQHAGARDRPHRAGAFDRSAASLHPALDRADGPGRGARPRLGETRRAPGVSPEIREGIMSDAIATLAELSRIALDAICASAPAGGACTRREGERCSGLGSDEPTRGALAIARRRDPSLNG